MFPQVTTMQHGAHEQTVRIGDQFAVLRHPYRRRILAELADHDPLTETELNPVTLASHEMEPKHAALQLHHSHLPMLSEYGFIDWNRETGDVRRGPKFVEIQPLLQLLEEHQVELPVDWP